MIRKELQAIHVRVALEAVCFRSLVIVEVDVLLLRRSKDLIVVQYPESERERAMVVTGEWSEWT
jgi:hypothetical protein